MAKTITYVVIGVSCGVYVSLMVLCTVLICVWRKRSKAKERRGSHQNGSSIEEAPESVQTAIPVQDMNQSLQPNGHVISSADDTRPSTDRYYSFIDKDVQSDDDHSMVENEHYSTVGNVGGSNSVGSVDDGSLVVEDHYSTIGGISSPPGTPYEEVQSVEGQTILRQKGPISDDHATGSANQRGSSEDSRPTSDSSLAQDGQPIYSQPDMSLKRKSSQNEARAQTPEPGSAEVEPQTPAVPPKPDNLIESSAPNTIEE